MNHNPSEKIMRIKLSEWRNQILNNDEKKEVVFNQAYQENHWFEKKEIDRMLHAITSQYLNEEKFQKWINAYSSPKSPKTIGLIGAGNIPLVLFHDLFCILSLGYKVKIKCSSKDSVLPKWILNLYLNNNNFIDQQILFVETIKEVDAIIATGSDLAGNYFVEYFKKYPNIIRTHRNSIALLTGNESQEELIRLGEDVFSYYGLGCRNVSKLYLPNEYDIERLLKIWDSNFNYVMDNNKYKNNYDYNLAINILNKSKMFQSETTLLIENNSIHSRIACLNFEKYSNIEDLDSKLELNHNKIQNVISNGKFDFPFSKLIGESQTPGLSDYADGIDTMNFLISLS
ncbi:MAG: acyl-CoA reductase [Saprospiraceae bacterium]|nr:acyl-CoA reductase [Saprospiraceae bacterium]